MRVYQLSDDSVSKFTSLVKAVVGGTAGPAMAGPLFWPKMVLAGPLFWLIMIFLPGHFFPADLDFLIR